MLPDLHTGFSRGRSGGLVFPSLSEFSTVYCDPHSQRLWHSQKTEIDVFLELSSMIQRILAIWSLVPLPSWFLLKPAWTSGNSQFMYCWSLAWRILSMHAESLQSCPTLCNSIECNLLASFVHGILQARILEWVAMPSSRGSCLPKDWTHVSYVSCIDRQILYQ